MAHVAPPPRGGLRHPTLPWDSPARPQGTLDPRRRQHASGAMLRWLLESGPPGGKVLGVTDQDLFIPILTYVFGEAQLRRHGRPSLHRPPGRGGGVPAAPAHRAALQGGGHEVGHAFGLHHCRHPACVWAARRPCAASREVTPALKRLRQRLRQPPARGIHDRHPHLHPGGGRRGDRPRVAGRLVEKDGPRWSGDGRPPCQAAGRAWSILVCD